MHGQRVDVGIVGCGGAGAAAAWWLAMRGRSVVAIDRFEPAHRRGSSHGTERIVRAAYADRVYVEMALASMACWRLLEEEVGHPLLTVTGGLDFGDVQELAEIVATCRDAKVPTDFLDQAEAQRRFPGFAFDGPVLHQPGTATIHAERAVAAMQHCARTRGAVIRHGEQVLAIEPSDDGVEIRSDRGVVHADTCIVTTGAWAGATLGPLVALPTITVTQEQAAYFRTGRSDWPTFVDRSDPTMYGLPTPDGLVKVGEHYTGPVVDPDRRDFALEPTTWERLLGWVERRLPGVDPRPVADTTCLYASSPSEDFVIDRVGRVVLAAGLGGHGFKFLPEIGRQLADLADGIELAGNPFALGGAARAAGRSGHK